MDRQRAFVLALIGSLLALSILFVLPVLDYFLLAVILASVLRPVQVRLRLRSVLGEVFAGGVIVIGTAVTSNVSLLLVVRPTFFEGRRLVTRVREGEVTFATIETSIVELTGMQSDLSELSDGRSRTAESVPSATWSRRSGRSRTS
jgi:predicted PurR-regulated permease PerM